MIDELTTENVDTDVECQNSKSSKSSETLGDPVQGSITLCKILESSKIRNHINVPEVGCLVSIVNQNLIGNIEDKKIDALEELDNAVSACCTLSQLLEAQSDQNSISISEVGNLLSVIVNDLIDGMQALCEKR